MFTVMFAIARTVGWVAHWQEMISDPDMRIGRPRQLYTGPTRRDYVEIGQARAERSALQALTRQRARWRRSSASSSSMSARRIGLPSTGLTGAWRMPSSGNTVASIGWSSSSKRTPGIGHDALRVQSHAPLGRPRARCRDPCSLIATDSARVGEQVQLYVGVLGGGAGQHRADQPRLELLQQAASRRAPRGAAP